MRHIDDQDITDVKGWHKRLTLKAICEHSTSCIVSSSRTEHAFHCHLLRSPLTEWQNIVSSLSPPPPARPLLACSSALFLDGNSPMMTWQTERPGADHGGVYVKPEWETQPERQEGDGCSPHFNQSSVATLRLLEFSLWHMRQTFMTW